MSARPSGTRLLTEPASRPGPPARLEGEAAGEGADGRSIAFEFALAPEAAPHLLRHRAIVAGRIGRTRSTSTTTLFHDAADGLLGEAGLTLAVESAGRRHVQRLAQIVPRAADRSDPAVPLPVLAEHRRQGTTTDVTLIEPLLPGRLRESIASAPLAPIAATTGRRSLITLGDPAPIRLDLFVGRLRTVAAERPVARLTLSVPAAFVDEAFSLVRALAEDLPLTPPWASLTEEARALAVGAEARPLRRGAPDLSEASSVEDGALRAIGHLTLALAGAAPIAAQGTVPEGVHQARVAVRRLRSALTLFKPAIGCAVLAALRDRLGHLARTLGPARDWDVFIMGTLADLRLALGDDPALGALARAAEAARLRAYDQVRAILDGPAFRLLLIDLAAVTASPPWRSDAAGTPPSSAADAGLRDSGLASFAQRSLERRHKRVRRLGQEFAHLDTDRLHQLRIEAKKLRYAGELFGPVFPGKRVRRFQKTVAALQDCLGHLNDVAMADALMHDLPGRGGARSFAAGIVRGWTAARAETARAGAAQAWAEFLDHDPFWRD